MLKFAYKPAFKRRVFFFLGAKDYSACKTKQSFKLTLQIAYIFSSPVRVIHSFSTQQQCTAGGVGTIFFNSTFHCYEVTFALVHPLAFNHEHAIHSNGSGPMFWRKQGSMMEDAEC